MENENREFASFGDMPIDYLMHHGIKGQRWGFRRYQNKDGSLTKAGRKRYAKLEAEMGKLGGKKSEGDEAPKPKKPKDMTDDELRSAINRLRMEDEYNRIYSQVHPQKVKNGKKYTDKLLTEAVAGVSEGAKQVIKDALIKKAKEALGLNDAEDSLAALKKAQQTIELKKKIAIDEDFFANRKAKQEKEKNKSETKTETKTKNESPKNDTKSSDDNEKTVYEGTVVNDGNSRGSSSSRKNDYSGPIVDADYTSIETSLVTTNGRRYISGLLDEPKDR